MYRFDLSVDIVAAVSRVWHALCDPGEVVQWDSGVTEALDAPPDYPMPDQHVRWTYRSGLWRVLHDRPQEVVAERRLRSILNLGPYVMDETYELAETTDGCRLELVVLLRVRVPVIGGLVEGVWAGPETKRGFAESLAGLKRWCEGSTADEERING
ncbi:MAG TPA: SRPBCC family protein [Dehalococcoidia bacterium]|nr:SRPBCC family protein [Dehalococcoidia bacterium]